MDALSRQFLDAWPTEELELDDGDFCERFTRFFASPSSAVQERTHLAIPCSRHPGRICDVYGRELCRATLPIYDFGFTGMALERAVRDMLGEAGVRAAYQPTSCLAPAVQEGWFREPGVSASQREQRMRIIPDFSSHLRFPAAATARGATASDRLLPSAVLLFDIKGVHFGKLYDGPRAREERAGAVAERAHQVGQEYRAHARSIDRRHGPFSTDVLDRLDRYGQVRGLCFGVYGEASGDVYHLIAAAAHQGAVRWGLYGARSQAEMRACLIARYRRRLGVAVARAMSQHLLRRADFVGLSAAAMQRYRQAQRMPGEGEREAQAWHGGAMQMHDLWHYQGRLDREAA